MGLIGNIGKDVRTEWGNLKKQTNDPGKPWINQIGDTALFTFDVAASTVLETFSSFGKAVGSAVIQQDDNKKKDDGDDGSGGHGSDNMYSGQAVGQFDTYSSYYTGDHENNLAHAPSGDVTLYAFNNIPITTNGTNPFAHLTD